MADRRGWHVDKGIGVAHILTTVGLALGGIWYIAGQDNRVSQAELNIRHLEAQMERDRQSIEKKHDELRVDLRLINSKLDRLIETQNRD
ncbi:hypothetical protein [Marinobacter shengliensis]|uniref:hypothetical protein n=1 Tax=Marinobacter shengliensis TaxID=1389223 RepID=UPI001109EE9D|nr:hypothetical protein [Marinobacter shengliensis]